MKFFIVLLFSINLLFSQEIKIAVAANVSYAMDELIVAFNKKYPTIDVKVILGSSGKLTAQIKHGAPYGLFLAANMRYPESLYHEKIATTKPIVYAKGALALFSSKKREFTGGLALLQNRDISKIAIANPKTAPYGAASVEALKKAKIYKKVVHKLVYAESISQAVAYAQRATDVGIIAKSSLFSTKMGNYKENSHWVSVDSALYKPIYQGMVLLKQAKPKGLYQKFYDFLLSDIAKKILLKYGYLHS
jgi:molybdate transport system substrate-binding protein